MKNSWYEDFLKSDDWKLLRAAALSRAKYQCEFCKEKAEHVHHVRYPKHGQPHTLDMLVVVCSRCHDISHGAKEMTSLTNAKNTKIEGPFNNSVSVYHANGLVWGSVEQWCSVLQAPYFMPEYLSRNAETQAALLKGGNYSASCGGKKVYRWPAIAAALDFWHRDWMVKVAQNQVSMMETSKRGESERFAKNIAKLKAWGYELQERELQNAMNSKMTAEQSESGIADVSQAMQAIQSLASATQTVLLKHGATLDSHEGKLNELKNEAPAFRDPEGYITVKQRCLERFVPFSVVVEGRMNLPQACGQYMQKQGFQKGSSQKERLDGSSLMTDVATWKRQDIDQAINYYMPEFEIPFVGNVSKE